MSACYVCDHEIIAICSRCGSELTIVDVRGVDLMRGEGTEVKIIPCECDGNGSPSSRCVVGRENEMNARELYNAIQRNERDDQQQVLFELASLIQTLSTAVLELAGDVKLKTGKDPLMLRSRLHLADFLELKPDKAN